MAQIAMTIIAIAEISINLLLIFFFIPSPSYVCPDFFLFLNGRHSTM